MFVIEYKKLSLEVREAFLKQLNTYPDTATIARKCGEDRDIILVRMSASNSVLEANRVDTYEGFPVEYEVRAPIRVGIWK